MSEEQVQESVEEVVEISESEKEARHQGWVPKDEFRGKETDWIDADTFVQRGREINPILKKNNERLQRETDKLKAEMVELRTATDEFKKFQKEQYERKSQELESTIKDLREQKKQAISSGDGERAVDLDEKIDALREEKQQAKEDSKEVPKQTSEPLDPVVADWVENNKWYSTDVRMAAAANVIAEDIKREQPWIKGKDFFEALDKALEDNFSPERLGKKSKRESIRSPVEGASTSGSSTSRGSKQSYESLPQEAKDACNNFVKQKLMTKEEYVASYYN